MSTENTRLGPRLVSDETESTKAAREVKVLAFEPNARPGEWQARQLALRRISAASPNPPTHTLPLVTAPRPRRGGLRGDARIAPLPVRLPVDAENTVEGPSPGRGRKVGVEIAPVESMPVERARYFLTLAEQRLQVPERNTIWTIKEAAWKALECDGPTPFTAMELRFDDYGSLREVSLEGKLFPAGALVLSPWPAYILAVVWIDGNAR